MKIVWTGAAGFIAGYTIEELLNNGHEVIGIDNFSKYGKVEKSYDKHPKYTFIEGVENPFSCTILIKGPNDYSIAQAKDAIRDGLRAVKNTIEDKCVIAGAGAFEVAAHNHLLDFIKEKVSGKVKLGV